MYHLLENHYKEISCLQLVTAVLFEKMEHPALSINYICLFPYC